ncbi:MAG: hypothetical protein A2Y14_02370 [Verrucomicrobia bacterium GWF2_51_19]|nr:MAG: hypothetical protein A2Y14_02370 [Verrucomicrobia bacterium GWF2_51_19]
MAMLMVSLTQIWINKDPGRKFFEKVSGVEVFLQTHLSIGYTPVDEPPLAIKRDPAIANGDPVLTFYMRKSSPFMEYDKEPHRPIECALHCDDREGLILYWRCPWSDKEVLQKYQKFTLAEAHQLDFYNYDIPLDAWKKADLKANDTTEVPEVLEILFKKDKMEKTVHICLKPRVAITREKKPKEDKQSPQPNKKKRAPKRKERK